jgi:TP901 family phage tail tape measure protein
MADANANIRIDVDTSAALQQIKELQRQISVFHSRMAQSGKQAAAESAKMQANLVNSINATKGFAAGMTNIRTSTESFTNSLEKNKFSMGEYFRYAGASTKTFGKLFKSEFNTINKVARERVKDLQTQYIKLGRDASGSMKAIKIRPTTLDMQNLGTQTAIAAQKQQLFNQLMKQGSTNLLNFGKNTQWAGRQLMVGFTIPLTIMGAAASREFMKLEEQAIRFKRVYGDMFTTDKETDAALDNIRELAKEFTKFGVSVEETIDLAASVAQMGAMGADLTNQVTQATRLAVLGGIEQQEALDTTISLTNAFGLATDQLAGKIAFLNAAENQTILSIEDFNEAIPKAGSVVKQLGGDVEDLAYFLTAMREGGINASQSANALKSSLARLINPTEVSKQKLGEFGVDILGIVNDNAGNLRKTIQVLAVELDKLDPLNKSRAIEQLFGKFQFARMSTLFENIVKDGSQANKILELTTNSTEELAIIAERELGRVSESPMYKFKKAIEEFQVALAPIGEAFLKLATPLIEFGSRVMEQFDKLSDGTKSFITGAVAIGGVVAPALIMVVGLLANGLANAIKFGMIVRNAFNGAAQSSDMLTDQYQYMNSEQIENAAIAASLDQVHSKLKQTFTSEAAAIQKLVAAYDRAIVKQNQMAASGAAFGGRSGRGAAPKKYNSGVVSVPGPKGKGDIVPAMLSPGEAVIPAKMAQKYAPLIQSMISGNIPGYITGTSNVAGLKAAGMQETHMATSMAKTEAVLGEVDKIYPGFSKLNSELQEAFVILSDLTATKSTRLNQAARGKGMSGEEFSQEWDRNSGQGFKNVGGRAIAAGQMRDGDDVDKELGKLDVEVGKRVRSRIDKMPASRKAVNGWLDALMEEVTDEVVEEFGRSKSEAKQEVSRGMKARKGTPAEVRTRKLGEITDPKTGKPYGSDDAYLQSMKKRGLTERKGLGIFAKGTDLKMGRPLYSHDKATRTAEQNAAQAAIARGEEPNLRFRSNSLSPSKFVGKVKGGTFQQGAKAKTKSTNPITTVFNDELEKQAQTASPSKRTKKIAKDTVDGYANELKRGQKKVSAAAKKAAEEKLKQEEAANRRSTAARKGWETRRRNMEAASQAGVGGGFMNRMRGAGGKFRGMGGKMAGAGMAASSAVMMASMVGGPIGDVAQKLMGPVMGLSAVLPMLTSKLGAGAVALGALVTVVMLANSSFKKAQEDALRLGESLGSGSAAMKKLSEASGKVSAGEVMDRRRENQFGVFQIQPGKNTFGNTFMGSESGEAMLGDVKSSLKTQGKDATQDMLRNQLTTAVASGAIDTAQARSIIASVATELQDYSFGIELNAQITELLGPNGENLAKDPVGIRVKILDESQAKLATSFENLNEAAGRSIGDNIAKYAGVAAGAGAGALAGAIAGSFIMPGIGTAIGAVVGTIGGAITGGIADIGGYIGSKISGDPSRRDRIGTASGASVAMAKIALQQQQEMLDSVEMEYEKKIAAAKATGDMAEAERLATEQVQARVRLLEQNRELTQQITDGFANADAELQKALMSGADKAMKKAYEGTALEDVVPLTGDIIESNVEDKEVQYLLKMQVASQEIGPLQMIEFLETFDKGSVEQTAVVNLMTEMGGAFANQTMSLLSLFEEDKAMQGSILMSIESTKSPEEAQAMLDFYQQLSQTDVVLEREAKFKFVMENPAAAAQLQKQMADIENFQGELTMDVVANVINADAVDALSADLDYYQGLNNEMKKIYLQTLVTTIATVSPDDPALKNWLGGEGSAYQSSPPGVQLREYAAYNAGVVTKIAADMSGQTTTPEPTGSGGGGPKGSVLDDLTKKIRDLRLETFKATVGWNASSKALDNLFKGGDKTLDVFTGLANKMRSLGANSSMIDMILGMDPKEFDKRKKELFNLDPDGNIVGLTSKFKSFNSAINAIALGEYVNTQEEFISNTQNQFTAMSTLTASGMSFVQAYEMVQNQALATAIAMAASNEEVTRLIELAQQMDEWKEKMSIVDEEAQAAKAISRTNEEFKNRYTALSRLAKDSSGLNDDQITAILNDPNLAKLYLNPTIDQAALDERLRQIKAQAQLELRLKVSTEEGKEALFDELMGDVNDRFSMLEEEIEVDFRLKTEDDQDIVREAQNKIADIQFEIDDYQAELKGIADQEQEINDKYDKRYEALEKVASAQEQIARAQKAQLDIADALTSGDIAAAARAQQELSQQEAAASREEKRAQLERAQASEIANLRSTSGKSREDIEKAIKERQDAIFKIEEEELEPAQDNIRVAEYQKELAIDNLEIAGKTRDEWAKMSSEVDIATFALDEFQHKLKQIQALYDYFKNGTPLDASLFGDDELQELINSGQVGKGDVYTPPEKKEEDPPEVVLPPEVIEALDAGEEVDETKLTQRQIAAKNLYQINQLGKEGALATLQSQLSDPKSANKVATRLAKQAGIIGEDGTMQMSADAAEKRMQSAIDAEATRLQRVRDQIYSKAYSDAVGTTNPDRLDSALQRDLSSQGISSNIGSKSPAQIAQQNKQTNQQNAIIADKRASSTPLPPVYPPPYKAPPPPPKSYTTSYNRPAPPPAPKPKPPVAPQGSDNRFKNMAGYSPPKTTYTAPPPPRYLTIGGQKIYYNRGGQVQGYAAGGKIGSRYKGSRMRSAVMPPKFARQGSDTVPAMLTPGEFVIRKPAVQSIGLDRLEKINKTGTYSNGSVYNYNLAVNVTSDADPNKIANTVMRELRRVESQRMRGTRF